MLAALSVKLRFPFSVPVVVGVKVTFSVHVPFGAMGEAVMQLPDTAKLPVVATPVTLRSAVPLFVRVTLFAVLVVLTTWFAKVRLVVERLTPGRVLIGGVNLVMKALPLEGEWLVV